MGLLLFWVPSATISGMKATSRSLADTHAFAEKILHMLAENPRAGAAVLSLYGDLGAGKTALTKEIARHLGVKDVVNSPTFILEKIYRTTHPLFKRLIHIDAYRLERPEELERLGWGELVGERENIIVVEWADKVEKLLPEDSLRMHADFVDEGTRTFHIHGQEKKRGKE